MKADDKLNISAMAVTLATFHALMSWLKAVAPEVLVLRNGLVQTKANILSEKTEGMISGEQEEGLRELGGLVAAHVLMGEE